MEDKKLHMLDYVNKLFKDITLDKVLLIATQHILGSQKTMFDYFIKKGLKPSNIFLMGKCYSTNKEVLTKFKESGVYVSPNSTKFNDLLSFDEQFEKYIKEFLVYIKNKVNLSNYEKVIILDDGGSLLSQTSKIFKNLSNFTGIEQTSAGYEKLKNTKPRFPIINVARSDTKLKIESPMIAEACLKELNKALAKLKIKPKKILIVGAGAVGNSIYELLKEKHSVKRYDLNQNPDFNKESLKSIIGEFDSIIGCTGREIINVPLYKCLKKGVVLVSASSSDREFSSVNLRKMAKKIKDCHENVFVEGIHLINCGFPVNFAGKKESVSPEKIQITLSLLFSALCIARKNRYKKGLVELDPKTQNKLRKEFEKIREP